MARQLIAGIDIGTYEVKIMIAEKSSGNSALLPTVLGSGSSPSEGLRRGYIVNRKDVAESIRTAKQTAEKQAKVRIKKTVLAMGGISLESFHSTGTTIISRADSEVTEIDVDKCLESAEESLRQSGSLQNKKILQTNPIFFKIDGKEVLGKPVGLKAGKLEVKVVFIVCLEQHLDECIQAVEESGMEVEDVIPSPIAAATAVLSKSQKIAGCLLANIGAGTVSTVVYEHDLPLSVKVFPIGGQDISNDIALGLQIPLTEAGQIKAGGVIGSNVPKKKLEEIIVARLSDIFELLENHLKKIGKNGLLPAGIVLTGGGAGINTMEELAKDSLELPAQIGNLRTFNNNFKNSIKGSEWAVAYGLCIISLSDEIKESVGLRHIKRTGRGILEWFKQFLP
jgi:cell division protein FtsA